MTVATPLVTPTNASGGPVDETAVLPPVRGEASGADSETTAKLPKPSVPSAGAAAEDETALLPQVPSGTADETAVLPPVRDDRVPPGYFRDERPATGGADGSDGSDMADASDGSDAVDRTRELPQVDEQGVPRRRPRSDWAEETPLDDLPTLADELLGAHGEDDTDERRGWGRRRR